MAFQGSLRELPLPDVIQLVAVSGKTGVFNLRDGSETGQIYLRKGQIVHATIGTLTGERAVYELARWFQGDFVFTPGTEAEAETIEKSNTNLLMEAARQIDEWKILSKKIESTRLVPVFSPQASRGSVSFTPGEWTLITRVDERRTIDEIAAALGQSAFDTCKTIYGLLTSGVLTLREDLRRLPVERVAAAGTPAVHAVAEQIHRLAQSLLAGSEWSAEVDGALRLFRAEAEAGDGAEALTHLVRAEEKLVSAHAGPVQGKEFVERVTSILQSV